MTKSLSSSSEQELEGRLHSLTESLIQKQTMLEALSTEKNSLMLQLERIEVDQASATTVHSMSRLLITMLTSVLSEAVQRPGSDVTAQYDDSRDDKR